MEIREITIAFCNLSVGYVMLFTPVYRPISKIGFEYRFWNAFLFTGLAMIVGEELQLFNSTSGAADSDWIIHGMTLVERNIGVNRRIAMVSILSMSFFLDPPVIFTSISGMFPIFFGRQFF